MDRYTELYAWIRQTFGNDPFDIDRFRATFPTSQAPKVIHDLVKDGYLQRVKRGTYKAVKPARWVAGVVEKSQNTKDILQHADHTYAYCESTAVAVWTKGYYWTGFTKGFKPLHINVLEDDLPSWKHFFISHRARYVLPNESKTLFGFVYVVHPQKSFEVVSKEGMNVIPLEEVVQFCLKHEVSYQPALEYLDEMCNIDYQKRVSINT